MTEWDRFGAGDCTVTTLLPAAAAERQAFTIRVLRGGVEIRRETVPLLHPPIFGVDAEDVAALQERTAGIIRELGLPSTCLRREPSTRAEALSDGAAFRHRQDNVE